MKNDINLITFLKDIRPDAGRLKKEKGVYKTTLFDIEMDPIEIDFPGDETAVINTKELNYLVLDFELMHKIKNTLERAEELYNKND